MLTSGHQAGGEPPPRTAAAFARRAPCLAALALTAGTAAPAPVQRQTDTARNSVLPVAGVIAALLLAAAILVGRRAFGTARTGAPGPAPDPPAETPEEKARRSGLAAAAGRHEAGGDKLKAAEFWEKAGNFGRAAECCEAGGDLESAARLHLRSGAALRAAGIYMRTGIYGEAAKIFREKGDHPRAAQAFELLGDLHAAAGEYAAAGNHARAVSLLEGRQLYAEAAQAYLPLLPGAGVTEANADLYCRYAALLALGGDRELAATTYRRVLAAAPGHLRALSALQGLLQRAPGPVRAATLRDVLDAGRIGPRKSMSLWVRVMRALAERHGANVVFGFLSPESIVIDRENGVRFEAPAGGSRPEYRSPEVRAGLPPDRPDDIYSMGLILYEMVSGSLEQFGNKRAGQLSPDVPPWLDDLIERCTEKSLARRFRTTEEVSAALLKLKDAARG